MPSSAFEQLSFTHKGFDFSFLDDKSENIAMPLKVPVNNDKNCKELVMCFEVYNPENNEIEQLREPYGDWCME